MPHPDDPMFGFDIVEASEEINNWVNKAFPRMTPWRRLKRSIRYWIQRRIRGFDDRIFWSFDVEVAQFLLPRLNRYIELREHSFEENYPMSEKMWNEMMKGLERTVERDMTENDNNCWKILSRYINRIYL
jgi:hypothetical protein